MSLNVNKTRFRTQKREGCVSLNGESGRKRLILEEGVEAFRERGADLPPGAVKWNGKAESFGMKHDPSDRQIRGIVSVERIAHDGKARLRQ